MENTNEIISNEIIEDVAEAIEKNNNGLVKAVKIGGVICGITCVVIVAYDHAIKPLVKTIKTKREEKKMAKEPQLLDIAESEEHTKDN